MRQTINELILFGEKKLKNITDNNLLDSKLLLSEVLNSDSIYLFLNSKEMVSEEKNKLYNSYLDRRILGEPLQYIIGHQEFMGLEFLVKEGVLIPRSDTEILVETVLNKLDSNGAYKILDIGTGSGAVHISLAHFMKNSEFVSVDISDIPIEIAKKNAIINNVSNRITYYNSDLFENIKEKFNVIVSNPPYIPTEVIDGLQNEVSFEPKIALDGGKDGYDFYKRIIIEAKDYLIGIGLVAFEVGHDQANTIKELFRLAGYVDIEIYKDLSSIERVVIARYER